MVHQELIVTRKPHAGEVRVRALRLPHQHDLGSSVSRPAPQHLGSTLRILDIDGGEGLARVVPIGAVVCPAQQGTFWQQHRSEGWPGRPCKPSSFPQHPAVESVDSLLQYTMVVVSLVVVDSGAAHRF